MHKILLLSLLLFSCTRLDDAEICGKRGLVIDGYVGSELSCSVPDGLQDSCMGEALREEANSGTVVGNYRLFDSEKDKSNRLSRLKDEAEKCVIKYPCGIGLNGPCFQ